MKKFTLAILFAFAFMSWSQAQVVLNEIRTDQPGADNDEYFELAGPAGTDVSAYTLIVLGDGATGTGTIEAVVPLSGTIPADGFMLIAEDADTFGEAADLIADLGFENGDNVTFILVEGFSGANGDDLDTDDDGTLDSTPWTSIIDAVAIIEEIKTLKRKLKALYFNSRGY